MDWLLFWQILAFVGNFSGFFWLKRIPKFQHSFSTKEDEWLVDAVWGSALMFVPFMLAFSGRLSRGIKDSLFLNACLNFICLAFPAIIEHLVEHPKFHIDVKDVEQHNSQKRIELFASFSFASMSFGLSKACDLTFESGFFSLCLGFAMKVSLEVVYRNGNRNVAFVLATYSFCFMVILLRKYLEENNGNNTTRQDNQALDSTNRVDQSPNNNEGADQNLLATSNADLQGGDNIPLVPLAPNQPRYHGILMPSFNGSSENLSSSQRDLRQELWDINEQNWESVPPKFYIDTSTEDGEEEEEVPSVSNFVVKEGKGFIITGQEISNRFVEDTNVNDDRTGKIEKREVLGQGTKNEEGDMRSTASSSHRKIVGSTGFGGYEKDDVPLILTRSNNIVDGETQIVNDHMEENKDQSQESDSQDYEIDNSDPLPSKSSLDNDDDDSSDGEESDGNDFHSGGGCKFGVDRRRKDRGQESDGQEQGGDDITDEGIKKPFSDEGTSRPSDDLNHDSSDNDRSAGDDFSSGIGCKDRVGRRGRNKSKDITDLDNLQLVRRSCLELSLGHCWMHKNFPPIFANQLPSAKIRKSSDNDNDNSSNGDGGNGDDFNNGEGCKVGVGRRANNDCPMKEGQDITNSEEFQLKCEICLLIDSVQQWIPRKFINRVSECPAPKVKISELSDDEGSYVDDVNGRAGSKNEVGQRGMNKCTMKLVKDITNLDELRSANRSFYGLPRKCWTHGILVQVTAPPVPDEISKPLEISPASENRIFFGPLGDCRTIGKLILISETPVPAEISIPFEFSNILENTNFLGLPSEFWTQGGLVQISAMPTPTEISKPSGLSSTLENASFFGLLNEFWTQGRLVQISAMPRPTEISGPSELPIIFANKSFFRLPSECSTHGHGIPVQISETLGPVEISKHDELLSSSTNRSFLGLPTDINIVSVQSSTTPTLTEISEPSNDDKGDSHDEGHDGWDLNTSMGCIPRYGWRGKKKHSLKEGTRSSILNILR